MCARRGCVCKHPAPYRKLPVLARGNSVAPEHALHLSTSVVWYPSNESSSIKVSLSSWATALPMGAAMSLVLQITKEQSAGGRVASAVACPHFAAALSMVLHLEMHLDAVH